MDLSDAATATPAAGKNKNKRVLSEELQEVEEDESRSCPYFPTSFEAGFGTISKHLVAEIWPQIEPLIGKVVVERFLSQLWPQIENSFRQQVREDIETMIQAQIYSRIPSLRENAEIGKHITTGSGTLKLKLCFCNPIDSIIFTNNEIKAENGESLKVVICDVTNSNSIISTGPLSSAQIQFFVLDGDFYSGQPRDETYWTSSDFNESILSSREGKRPLIIGSDLKLHMEMGVGFIKNLIVTDNSSWMRSKTFCLGAKIRDERIAAEFPRIGEAVSKPFRVMDHRGEVNKKHHPPSREDEVWRLEGIARDGTYHKNLSSEGINNVGDFLKAYRERGPITLKMLLGKRVLEKTWNMMVKNAEECVDVPVYHPEKCVDVLDYHAEECVDVSNYHVEECVDFPAYHAEQCVDVSTHHVEECVDVPAYHTDQVCSDVPAYRAEQCVDVPNYHVEECVIDVPTYHVEERVDVLGYHVDKKCVNVPSYHAEECTDVLAYDQTSEIHLVESEVIGVEASNKNIEICEQENLCNSDEHLYCDEWWLTIINIDDLSPSLSPHGESFNNTGTHTPYAIL